MRTIISYLFLLIIACACQKSNDKQANQLVIIDIGKEYPQREIYLQDIAEVEYIPLATSDSLLVDTNIISVSEEGIATSGGKEGEILLFDAQGQKLQGRIFQRGKGPKEYNAIIFSIVDWKRKEVFIADYTSLKVYDFSGHYRRTLLKEDIMGMNIHNLNDNYLLCSKEYKDTDKPYHPYFTLSKNDGETDTLSVEVPFFIASHRKILWDDGHTNDAYEYLPQITSCLDRIWLTSTALDTVFQLHPDLSLTPIMAPRLTPTTNPEAPLLRFLGMNDLYAWSSWRPRQVTVKMSDMINGTEKKKDLFMYDRNNNSWFIPVYRDRSMSHTHPIHINTRVVPYGYGLVILNPMDLVDAYQQNQITDSRLKEIASTLQEEDNPVLMLLKFTNNKQNRQ